MGHCYTIFFFSIRFSLNNYRKHKEEIDKLVHHSFWEVDMGNRDFDEDDYEDDCDDDYKKYGYPQITCKEIGKYDLDVSYLEEILKKFEELNIDILNNGSKFIAVGEAEEFGCFAVEMLNYKVKKFELDFSNLVFKRVANSI